MTNPLNTDRVSKLIVLLSSDKPYEVLAAVHALDKTLKGSNLTWHDLAARINGKSLEKKKDAPPPKPKPYYPGGARYTTSEDKFTTLLRANLTPWERDFVNSVYKQWRTRGTFSERQSEVLNDILNKAKNR